MDQIDTYILSASIIAGGLMHRIPCGLGGEERQDALDEIVDDAVELADKIESKCQAQVELMNAEFKKRQEGGGNG